MDGHFKGYQNGKHIEPPEQEIRNKHSEK